MYLLDTCAFLYYLEGNPKLSKKAKEIIESESELFLSLVTLWEIAIKKTIKKLNLAETTFELEDICKKGNISLLPIKSRYFETIQKLPFIHGDPFDRLIMATAIDENLTLLTDDKNIKKYKEVKRLW